MFPQTSWGQFHQKIHNSRLRLFFDETIFFMCPATTHPPVFLSKNNRSRLLYFGETGLWSIKGQPGQLRSLTFSDFIYIFSSHNYLYGKLWRSFCMKHPFHPNMGGNEVLVPLDHQRSMTSCDKMKFEIFTGRFISGHLKPTTTCSDTPRDHNDIT